MSADCRRRASRLTEASAVLGGDDERLDHLGRGEVAAVVVELREPEAVPARVWVSVQVSEVLHQHEGRPELRLPH